jgi:hypothetical protein
MAKGLEEARKELEEEYANVRKHLGEIEMAWRAVSDSNVESDIVGLLETLEDVTKKVRTGGVLGSGANDHARALKDYLEAKGTTTTNK